MCSFHHFFHFIFYLLFVFHLRIFCWSCCVFMGDSTYCCYHYNFMFHCGPYFLAATLCDTCMLQLSITHSCTHTLPHQAGGRKKKEEGRRKEKKKRRRGERTLSHMPILPIILDISSQPLSNLLPHAHTCTHAGRNERAGAEGGGKRGNILWQV